VIGEVEGNPNSLHIDFSNNPNFDYDGTQNPGKPGLPDEGKDVPTGKTPEDTVRTYTTGLKLIKVDENGNTLTGAEFKIEGDNLVEILTVETVNYKEDANGEYWKLNDNTYTKTAPQTEDKMEKKTSRDSGYVKTDDTARDGYITVGGEGYAIANAEELAGTVTLYKLIEANADLYESTETKYAIDTVTYTQKNAVTGQTYTKEVGADGTLILAGLGEGTYTITETKTPAGYNSLTGPITVEIKWTEPNTEDGGDLDCEWEAAYTYGSATGSLNMNAGGIFELEIENQSGSTLPSTGGMGTTLFYAFGGLLVAAAVVLLVTKKRMASAQ
jgi:LPXTG-motif cell wall-anchored protein